MPRGGRRPGAGRKAGTIRMVQLRGGQDRGEARPVVASAVSDMPEGLAGDVATTWADLAPHAREAGTLTPATAASFVGFCRALVKHAAMEAQIAREGLTYLKVTIDGSGQEHTEVRAHPLLARAHALETSLRAWSKDFMLTPFGKPIAAPVVDDNPFARFERTS